MADYREISQTYAQGAIKAVMLVNGGAAIAVLSQFSQLSQLQGGVAIVQPKSIALSLLIFSFGVLAGVLAWGLGFVSTRHVDRADCGQNPDYKLADEFMFGGYIAFAFSMICFLIGVLNLVCSIQ